MKHVSELNKLRRDLVQAMKYAEVVEGDPVWQWFQDRIKEQQPQPVLPLLERIKKRSRR